MEQQNRLGKHTAAMSHDPNNVQQETPQQCFSDFFLGIGQEDCANNGFNFNVAHEMTPRYQPHMAHSESPLQMPDPGVKGNMTSNGGANVAVGDDCVFTNTQTSYYNQGTNQPFVPYSGTGNYNEAVAYRNCQMPGQNFDGGYGHTLSPNSADRASISNSPYTPNVRQDFPISPPSNVPQKTGSIPSLSDYPGENNFEIYFGASTESAVKSAQYTHSILLGKLFVKMNVLCPIQFRCQPQPPEGSILRALPVYTRPEHVTEIVSRCPNHQIQDNGVDHLSRHLIRAEQPGTNSVQYGVSSDGRESVTVAYIAPDIGTQYMTVFYKYMCLSSCVGGINRRPIMTVFRLESPDGTILGRRCVEVRVCSCPGRDRSQEERRKRKPCIPPGYVLLPKKKKSASAPSTSTSEPDSHNHEEFILRVKGKEKYDILRKIKEALDLQELIPREQKEEYQQKEASEEVKSMREILRNYFKQSHDRDDNGGAPYPT